VLVSQPPCRLVEKLVVVVVVVVLVAAS